MACTLIGVSLRVFCDVSSDDFDSVSGGISNGNSDSASDRIFDGFFDGSSEDIADGASDDISGDTSNGSCAGTLVTPAPASRHTVAAGRGLFAEINMLIEP